jgi:hypothetical protein
MQVTPFGNLGDGKLRPIALNPATTVPFVVR